MTWEEFEKEFEKIKTERQKATPTTPTITGGVYDIPKLQTEVETTKTKLASAESALTGYQTKRYDEEYGKAGAEATKGQIATLDSTIASEKQKRDVSISKTRKNPYYSAATIAGETAEIERLANATINNYIEERNAMANRYNTSLGEITNKVARETAEKEKEVEGLRYNLNWLTGQLGTYETVRERELARGKEATQWELDFAYKLEDAKRKRTEWEAEEKRRWYEAETTRKKAVTPEAPKTYTDPTTNITYYWDEKTGKYRPMTEVITTPTGAAAEGALTYGERDFRSKVASKIKEGRPLDELKTMGTGVTIKFPATKTAAQIVEEEWNKAHPTGWFGKFKKWLPLGY